MSILILGGTQFVGRHIAEALLLAGHEVTVFNRGRTDDELPAGVTRLRGDRDTGIDGLTALHDGRWDACVDVSGYTLRQVRPTAELLRGKVGRYIYTSAVSVYGDPCGTPVDEEFPLVEPAGEDVTEIDRKTYGPLKVACERIVRDIYADRCTILRPQIFAGPHDPLDRFSYWVRRSLQAGVMLSPGDGSDHLQVIAARDVADFVVKVIEGDVAGCFNLSGRRLTWADFMDVLGATDLAWTPATVIKPAGVTEFELPLYRPDGGPRSSLMHVDNGRAIAAGLKLTDLPETVSAVREWLSRDDRLTPALSAERERQLIRLAAAG